MDAVIAADQGTIPFQYWRRPMSKTTPPSPSNGHENATGPTHTTGGPEAAKSVDDLIADAAAVSGGANSVFSDLSSVAIAPTELVGQQRIVTRVPVKKPDKQVFFRAHPTDKVETYVIEDKENRETYYVLPAMRDEIVAQGLHRPVLLARVITKQAVNMLWPIGLSVDGRSNSWHETAQEARQLAETNWIRIVPNMALGGYEVFKSRAPVDEPDWSTMTFQELLEVAFRNRIISSFDHPVLKHWLGEPI
jgi:hypothetical protein